MGSYYPFGLKHKGYNNNISSLGNSTAQKKAYANKEIQDDLGLNLIDFGARLYDPAIGRWNAIDPLAEEYFNDGTYNYVQNTPMRAIDPNGMEIVIIGSKKYTQDIINFLAKLGSSSQKGAKLVLDAIKSKKKFVIYDPSSKGAHAKLDNFSTDNENGYETLAFDVGQANDPLNAENGRNGKELMKTGETSLAHELSHFNSSDNGTNTLEGTRDVSRDEVNAVKEENQVRREMGLPERTHYKGINVYGKEAVPSKKYSNQSRLVRDKDYSVNVPGIGKKSFQIIFKYYTNMKYQNLKKYYRGGGTLVGKGHLKNKAQKKQLLINNVK